MRIDVVWEDSLYGPWSVSLYAGSCWGPVTAWLSGDTMRERAGYYARQRLMPNAVDKCAFAGDFRFKRKINALWT